MSAPISEDLRLRVVQARQDGLTIEATAERFSIGTASDQRWTQQFRETGSVAPKPHNGGPKPKIRDEGADVLRALTELGLRRKKGARSRPGGTAHG